MSTRNTNGKLLNEKVQIHPDGGGEYWRDVVGKEGSYRISDRGRLRSIPRRRRNKQGWCIRRGKMIALSSISKKSPYLIGAGILIHRAVLESFVGPCPKGMECRHLDGNPNNNHLDNLCWGTKKEQYQDRIRHGTDNETTGKVSGEKNGFSKLTSDEVLKIRSMYATGKYTMLQLGKLFGVSKNQVSLIIQRKRWNHI